jgi:hypothetical protein
MRNVADLQRLSNLQGNHHYDLSEYKVRIITLDEIESKMVVEARDVDLDSKLESGVGASGRPPCPHCGRTNHSPESCWIKYLHETSKKKFPQKKGYNEYPDKSEGTGATTHQVCSVMTRTVPEEWILDSDASTYMIGIKALLKDRK